MLLPIDFRNLCFHFFCLILFSDFFLFLQWLIGFILSILFSLHIFVLSLFSCNSLLVSYCCVQEKCLIQFIFSEICWDLFCHLLCDLSWRTFHVHLKRMCILLFLHELFHRYIGSPMTLLAYLRPLLSHWIHVWMICYWWKWGVKVPYYYCFIVDFSLYMY